MSGRPLHGPRHRTALVALVAACLCALPARAEDADADGIEDGLDNCPAEKGSAANFGCKAPQLASIKPPRIEISQKVFFKQGGSVVDAGSYKLLDQVAAIIAGHEDFGTIRVEAHTDDQLDPEKSLKLTQDRADNVRAYLIRKGIPEDRLSSFGLGLEKPVAPNDTPANKSLNRRILFVVESMEAPAPSPAPPPPKVEEPPPPPKVEAPPPAPAVTPQVVRMLPATVAAGRVAFETRIESDAPVLVATLYRRDVGESVWEAVPLASSKPPVYAARIEVAQDFEFYVEAFDTSGRPPLMDGANQAPVRVTVTGKPSAPKRRPAGPPPPPPPPEPPRQPLPRSRVGLVRTAVAPVPGRGEVSVSGALVRGDDFLLPNATLSGGTLGLDASYALFRFLEVGAQVGGRASTLRTSAARFSGSSIGDAALRVRGVAPSLGAVTLALEVGLGIPAAVDTARLAASPSLTGAATVALGRLNVHGMLGYRWDNSENLYPGRWSAFAAHAMGLSRFDALSVGAAVEWGLGGIVPFAEYLLELPVDRRALAACDAAECASPPGLLAAPASAWPQRAAAGLRLELAERVALQASAEWSLTGAGRGSGDAKVRTLPAPEGLLLPAPFSLGATLLWQFGTPLTPAATTPATPSTTAEPAAKAPEPEPKAAESGARTTEVPEKKREISMPSTVAQPPAAQTPEPPAPAAEAAPSTPPADPAPAPPPDPAPAPVEKAP